MSARLVHEPLDLAALLAGVQAADRGGTCLFVGSVRPDDGVVAIDYSAHEDMAVAELERILAEAQNQWPEAATSVEHRLGRVAVGEASVAVAAAAPHRQSAFEACRFVIEALKVRVPVWKREECRDGTARWADNEGRRTASDPGPPRSDSPADGGVAAMPPPGPTEGSAR
jgi:molybdopterin synthase catalytic subunit